MPNRRWAAAGAISFAALGVLSYSASANLSGGVPGANGSAAGAVVLSVGDSGTVNNRLTVGSHDLAPGDKVQRQLMLAVANEAGTIDAVTLTTTGSGTPPSFLTDSEHGLQLWISACSEAWTEVAAGPSYTYTCAGNEHDVLGTVAVGVPILQAQSLLSSIELGDGAQNQLRVQMELPASAPPSMQGQSDTTTFLFEGVSLIEGRVPSGGARRTAGDR